MGRYYNSLTFERAASLRVPENLTNNNTMIHFNTFSTSAPRCSRRVNHFSRMPGGFGGFSNWKWRVSGFILPVIVVLMMVAVGPRASKAQCPSTAWIDAGEYDSLQIPGTNCYITIDWCYTWVGDTILTYVHEIIPDSSSACDSISNLELILDAGELADSMTMVGNEGDFIVPFCNSDSSITTQSYLSPCWQQNAHVIKGHEKSWGLYACSDEFSPCYRQCKWCYDPGSGLVRSNCTTTNSYVSVICGPSAPNGPWTWGECYTTGCLWLPNPEKKTTPQTSIPIDRSLQLYPNPSAGMLTVSSSEIGTNVDVLDMLGRSVLSGVIPKNGPLVFDVSPLPNGVYYVSEGQTEIRFVKN